MLPTPDMKSFLLFAACLLVVFPAQSQELNCSVNVNYTSLAGSDYSYMTELRERAMEYFNNRRWTEDRFEETERIECTVSIVLLEAITLTSFRARFIIASRRPIYGTAQQSPVVQFSDEDWRFDYPQGTPLVWDPDRYHALTSVLNFYALTIIGFDYDSFSQFGGTPYFERARRVAEVAQGSGAAGWQALGGDRSRGELISEILDPRFRDLRQAYFDYHFNSLDRFVSNTDRARASMFSTLESLSGLYEDVSSAYFLDQFFATKYQE